MKKLSGFWNILNEAVFFIELLKNSIKNFLNYCVVKELAKRNCIFFGTSKIQDHRALSGCKTVHKCKTFDPNIDFEDKEWFEYNAECNHKLVGSIQSQQQGRKQLESSFFWISDRFHCWNFHCFWFLCVQQSKLFENTLNSIKCW